MIGNDIVDLQLAETESNWQRTGFFRETIHQKKNEKLF